MLADLISGNNQNAAVFRESQVRFKSFKGLSQKTRYVNLNRLGSLKFYKEYLLNFIYIDSF